MVFEKKGITVTEEVDAKKQVYNGEDALAVVADARMVYVASGKKILELAPGETEKEELLKRITGRTGNLRAPTLKAGDIFYVGFNTEMYENLG